MLFMVISGDTHSAYTTISTFIYNLRNDIDDIAAVFIEVIVI